MYPVHYELSDTSGEKQFEEFFTENETVDVGRFRSIGIITDKQICDRSKLSTLFAELENVFLGENAKKEDIVRIMGDYLPNFSHIETGKSLDGKM